VDEDRQNSGGQTEEKVGIDEREAHFLIPNFKIQMSNECQSSKLDPEMSPERHSCHAELVSASHLSFGSDLKFELWHLTFPLVLSFDIRISNF
jgi:hypothetical protein